MARRTKQEAEETRENILSAALDVIYEKGYARSTFVNIAKEIKLTKGAIYWHFKSKPDMFLALGRQMEDKIETTLHDIFYETHTLNEYRQMLFKMILLISEDVQLRKYYSIVFYRMEWTDELLSMKQFFDQQEEDMVQWSKDILRQAQLRKEIPQEKNIDHLARALSALAGGLLAYCLSDPNDGTGKRSKIVQLGLDTFFAGLCKANDYLPNEGRP